MATQQTIEQSLSRKFRLQAKTYFLTWPQNVLDKDELLERCVALWGDIVNYIVIAAEEHKSGEPHLHAIINFKEKHTICDAIPVLDALTGKHGNYQGAKSAPKVLRYVCKGGNYVSFGELPDMSEKVNLSDKLAKLIYEGGTFAQCKEEAPGYSMLNKRKIDEFAIWCKRQKMMEDKIPWAGCEPSDHYAIGQITEWLNMNLLKPRVPRQKQLWLCGPPGIGKSRLIGQLHSRLRVYDMPRDEDWYDEYEDGCYDLIVMDEYKSHKKIQFLNSWLDGSVVPFKIKGKQGVKHDNLPFIICSNFTPEQCYKEGVGRDALVDRFTVVDCRDELVLTFL